MQISLFLFFTVEEHAEITFKSALSEELDVNIKQSVSVRVCVRASHACVRKSKCEGGAKLHEFVRANVRAFRVF